MKRAILGFPTFVPARLIQDRDDNDREDDRREEDDDDHENHDD
jgi:hypothetical protein